MSEKIESYNTIGAPSKGLFKDKGSKFIACAYPVTSEDEVKERLKELRSEYHDARHHCYAYMLGYEKDKHRVNDDGEPSSTAGKPILGQINSNDLTNILIVVIRYFGGTLLGVGGLINAYRKAALDAIQNAKIQNRKLHDIYNIKFEYPEMNDVMRILKETNAKQIGQDFGTSCLITIEKERNSSDQVFKRLELLDNLKLEFVEIR